MYVQITPNRFEQQRMSISAAARVPAGYAVLFRAELAAYVCVVNCRVGEWDMLISSRKVGKVGQSHLPRLPRCVSIDLPRYVCTHLVALSPLTRILVCIHACRRYSAATPTLDARMLFTSPVAEGRGSRKRFPLPHYLASPPSPKSSPTHPTHPSTHPIRIPFKPTHPPSLQT